MMAEASTVGCANFQAEQSKDCEHESNRRGTGSLMVREQDLCYACALAESRAPRHPKPRDHPKSDGAWRHWVHPASKPEVGSIRGVT